jgi:hypothetical protein
VLLGRAGTGEGFDACGENPGEGRLLPELKKNLPRQIRLCELGPATMPSIVHHGRRRWTSEQRWAVVRITLGYVQIAGATAAFILLAQVGVTPLSLGIVVATGLCTSISVLLFGSRMPRWKDKR